MENCGWKSQSPGTGLRGEVKDDGSFLINGQYRTEAIIRTDARNRVGHVVITKLVTWSYRTDCHVSTVKNPEVRCEGTCVEQINGSFADASKERFGTETPLTAFRDRSCRAVISKTSFSITAYRRVICIDSTEYRGAM